MTSNADNLADREPDHRNEEPAEAHRCPVCEIVFTDTGAPTFPFCSERCRMVDLGKWLNGRYVVSRPANDPRDWEEQNEE